MECILKYTTGQKSEMFLITLQFLFNKNVLETGNNKNNSWHS